MIDPENPSMNAIIFFIFIMSIILIIKPNCLYCNKNKQFKSFGFGEGNTFMTLPIIAIILSIILYMIFLWIEILFTYFNKKN